MNRPEYVTCVRQTKKDQIHLSWCGRDIQDGGFYYTEIDHAAYDQRAGSCLLICPECLIEIIMALHGLKTQIKR